MEENVPVVDGRRGESQVQLRVFVGGRIGCLLVSRYCSASDPDDIPSMLKARRDGPDIRYEYRRSSPIACGYCQY